MAMSGTELIDRAPPVQAPSARFEPAPAGRGLPIAATILGALLLVPFLGDVPGLHGDEAWVGLRVHEIAQGARPLYGMNAYTGPVHQYLLLPLLEVFGYRVWALRSFTVVASLLALLLYHAIVKRLFGGETAGLAALALVSMPFFALYGRVATENFALNPLGALAACWLLLVARERRGAAQLALAASAGAVMALATWSHLIFLPVPGALALAALAARRGALLRSRVFLGALAGFALGALPRLVAQLVAPPAGPGGLGDAVHQLLALLPLRLREWPALLLEVLHGDVLYKRFTGELVWPSGLYPVGAALFVIGLVLAGLRALRAPGDAAARAGGRLLLAFGVLFLFTLVLTPHNADRYLLLVLWFAPLFVALALRAVRERTRALGSALVVLLVALGAARTGVNFLFAHLRSGGKVSVLALGSMAETSNHFVASDRLYELLVARGWKDVFTEFMIGTPLEFYDLEHRKLAHVQILEQIAGPDGISVPRDTVVIAYVGGQSLIEPGKLGAIVPITRVGEFALYRFGRP
jgi:4-amino-4-deoxy-L-arabinose transferase-like glycosyltransferase